MKVRGSSQKRKEPSPISKMELFAKIVDWVLNTLLQPAGESVPRNFPNCHSKYSRFLYFHI